MHFRRLLPLSCTQVCPPFPNFYTHCYDVWIEQSMASTNQELLPNHIFNHSLKWNCKLWFGSNFWLTLTIVCNQETREGRKESVHRTGERGEYMSPRYIPDPPWFSGSRLCCLNWATVPVCVSQGRRWHSFFWLEVAVRVKGFGFKRVIFFILQT